MSGEDIWGDIEIQMLREGIKQLEADKSRLISANQFMRMTLSLLRSGRYDKAELQRICDDAIAGGEIKQTAPLV